jgi:hypothetical protein
VNTHDPYERRISQPTPYVEPSSDLPQEPPALAVHSDPSQPQLAPTDPPELPGRRIAWVRPSELPTVVMTPVVGRGINLQAELTRRARRSPITATRASRRISRSTIARPERATPTEGLQL